MALTKTPICNFGEKAKDFGDEAVYMARESKALVCVCKDKLKAAKLLVKSGAEIIISDDGLQHYSLAAIDIQKTTEHITNKTTTCLRTTNMHMYWNNCLRLCRQSPCYG